MARFSLVVLVSLCAALAPGLAVAASDTAQEGLVKGEPLRFRSAYLEGAIVVPPGVFSPDEAEEDVLPLMAVNRALFDGKRVLQIGAGSGINSLFAAQLGAAKVIATDISVAAVETVRRNADAMGVGDVVEARLVPASDMSAYSVIGSEERFDTILSNPPYSLDLDAPSDDAVTDTGDLGFSIVNGLDAHLKPGGAALLFYKSVFYHYVMVKYARYRGFDVANADPKKLTIWEAESLFNSYLARLLEREGIEPDAFRFDWRQDADALRLRRKDASHRSLSQRIGAWLGGGSGDAPVLDIPGWIAIRRAAAPPVEPRGD
jgi:predicted RNA methylase